MTRSIPFGALLVSTVAIAFGAAGTAQADTSEDAARAKNIKAVVVLIGANDYGVVAEPVAPRNPE